MATFLSLRKTRSEENMEAKRFPKTSERRLIGSKFKSVVESVYRLCGFPFGGLCGESLISL